MSFHFNAFVTDDGQKTAFIIGRRHVLYLEKCQKRQLYIHVTAEDGET